MPSVGLILRPDNVPIISVTLSFGAPRRALCLRQVRYPRTGARSKAALRPRTLHRVGHRRGLGARLRPYTSRGLVVLKASIVDAEFGKLDLNLRAQRGAGRMVSLTAYEAGGVAGASLAINRAIGERANSGPPKGRRQRRTQEATAKG